MTGSDIMLVMCALTISLSFPYLLVSMCFVRSLPSSVNGRPSSVAQTFGSNKLLKIRELGNR